MKVSSLFLSTTAMCASAIASMAQTVYTINGPAGMVAEQTGPGVGPCGYPNGPLVSAFPTTVPFGCPTVPLFAPPPALVGDVAVARGTNLIYATDGFVITAYTPAGVAVNSFLVAATLPAFPPVTGMGIDGVTGILWLTNGALAAGILPPGVPCTPAAVAVPPFPLPAGAGPYTDIDWDPSTGSLFACSVTGAIANVVPGGAFGPFAVYLPALLCLAPPFYGLAMDHAAAPGTATMYLTDGFGIERTAIPGVPLGPTFYSPAPCFLVALPPASGLAFSAHAITFGTSVPATGPTLAGIGQSISPNPTFAVTMTGATPGTFGLIYYSAFFNCPAIPFGLNLIYIGLFPPPVLLTSGIIPASGVLTGPAPIPPFMPIPGALYLQGFTAGSSIENTSGLEISFTRP